MKLSNINTDKLSEAMDITYKSLKELTLLKIIHGDVKDGDYFDVMHIQFIFKDSQNNDEKTISRSGVSMLLHEKK